MPKTPIKQVKPNGQHLAFRMDLITLLRKYEHLRADEMLSITAHFVGQLIAFQDQRTMTPQMAMDLVQAGIEQGNKEALAELRGPAGGTA